jgi:hypothetical protein
VWLGTSRALCPACYADPRFGGRWIDERQKATAQKPAWAADEPEEFDKPVPPVRTGPLPARNAPDKPAAPVKAVAPARPAVTPEPDPSRKAKSAATPRRTDKPRKKPRTGR